MANHFHQGSPPNVSNQRGGRRYVEIADAPFRSKAYGAVKYRCDSDIILRQEFLLAYLTGSIPGRAATHNIEIIAHCNDASDDERTAAKYGVVAYG